MPGAARDFGLSWQSVTPPSQMARLHASECSDLRRPPINLSQPLANHHLISDSPARGNSRAHQRSPTLAFESSASHGPMAFVNRHLSVGRARSKQRHLCVPGAVCPILRAPSRRNLPLLDEENQAKATKPHPAGCSPPRTRWRPADEGLHHLFPRSDSVP